MYKLVADKEEGKKSNYCLFLIESHEVMKKTRGEEESIVSEITSIERSLFNHVHLSFFEIR